MKVRNAIRYILILNTTTSRCHSKYSALSLAPYNPVHCTGRACGSMFPQLHGALCDVWGPQATPTNDVFLVLTIHPRHPSCALLRKTMSWTRAAVSSQREVHFRGGSACETEISNCTVANYISRCHRFSTYWQRDFDGPSGLANV